MQITPFGPGTGEQPRTEISTQSWTADAMIDVDPVFVQIGGYFTGIGLIVDRVVWVGSGSKLARRRRRHTHRDRWWNPDQLALLDEPGVIGAGVAGAPAHPGGMLSGRAAGGLGRTDGSWRGPLPGG